MSVKKQTMILYSNSGYFRWFVIKILNCLIFVKNVMGKPATTLLTPFITIEIKQLSHIH